MRKEAWYQYQEDICTHFRSIGANAQTNVTLAGVRTDHDIDILVETKYLGQNFTWIIEAKHWSKKVSKLHVSALVHIAQEIGVDSAFLISQKGFQKGAIEAAKNTNVRLKTFEELKQETKGFVESEIIKSYIKRLNVIEDRYWAHSKGIRIKYGLRDDPYEFALNFSGQVLLMTARRALMEAAEMQYPIELYTMHSETQGELFANNFQELQNWLNLNLNYFDEKLLTAEWAMHKNNEYKPDAVRAPEGEWYVGEMMAKGQYKAKRKD